MYVHEKVLRVHSSEPVDGAVCFQLEERLDEAVALYVREAAVGLAEAHLSSPRRTRLRRAESPRPYLGGRCTSARAPSGRRSSRRRTLRERIARRAVGRSEPAAHQCVVRDLVVRGRLRARLRVRVLLRGLRAAAARCDVPYIPGVLVPYASSSLSVIIMHSLHVLREGDMLANNYGLG